MNTLLIKHLHFSFLLAKFKFKREKKNVTQHEGNSMTDSYLQIRLINDQLRTVSANLK